jgi:hypothetical protein
MRAGDPMSKTGQNNAGAGMAAAGAPVQIGQPATTKPYGCSITD